MLHTVCPRSLDPFDIVNWVKTSWTDSTNLVIINIYIEHLVFSLINSRVINYTIILPSEQILPLRSFSLYDFLRVVHYIVPKIEHSINIGHNIMNNQ